MSENRNEEFSSEGLGYGQILSVLWRRRLWILGALCLTVPLAAYNSLQKEPTFRSSMQLLVEPNYRDSDAVARARGDDIRFAEGAPPEIDYATQIKIMQGSALLERASEMVRVEYPDIETEDIQERLAVFQVTATEDDVETNILQVDYFDNDPDKVQRVLEAVKSVYLAYNLEQQQLRLETGLSFINEQLPVVQQELQEAEQSLELYREGQGLIDPQLQATELTNALATIEQRRREVRSEFEDLQAQYDILQRQLARAPQDALIASRLSESERYQNLLNQYQDVEVALADLESTFTTDAPNVRLLRRQLENQRALLQQEITRVLGASGGGLAASDVLSQGQLGDIDLTLAGNLVQIQTQLSGLAARDRSLAQTEQQIRQELARFPEIIAEYDRLQPEITIRRDTLQQLLRARQELSINIARGGFNWQIIEEPSWGEQTGPNVKMDIVLGGIAGLFLGTVLAFIRESLDSKVRSEEQLRELSNLPQLGKLPLFRLPSKSGGALASLPGINRLPGVRRLPGSIHAPGMELLPGTIIRSTEDMVPKAFQALQWVPFRESLDFLYKNIQLLNPAGAATSIAITSSVEQEGKSMVALGLAVTASRLHQRVLLIDADLRNPTLHLCLGVAGDRGLTSMLTEQEDSACFYRVSWNDCDFDFLASGSIPNDPVRLLSSQSMNNMLREFEKKYDLILLDTSSVLGQVDALQTASVCRGTLLVTCLDQVSRSEVMESLSLLQRFNLIGVVANGLQSTQKAVREEVNSQKVDIYQFEVGAENAEEHRSKCHNPML